MSHGRVQEAEEIVAYIESKVQSEMDEPLEEIPDSKYIAIRQNQQNYFQSIMISMQRYPKRSILAFVLMATQSFFYCSIFYTYGLILQQYFDVPQDKIGYYIFPFAAGNFLGCLLLGRLFDTYGRRTLICITYIVSGIILFIGSYLFYLDIISSAESMTIVWSSTFFFASAGASAAYLQVSEIFPLEVRAIAIAWFYSCGTAIGGIIGPIFFGQMIALETTGYLFLAYTVACVVMIFGGIIGGLLGIQAEMKSLEEIADPISKANIQENHEEEKQESYIYHKEKEMLKKAL